MNQSTPFKVYPFITASLCSYADHNDAIRNKYNAPNTVACSGPATFMVHDKRGCRVVCSAHAHWCMAQSRMMGHSVNCPLVQKRPKPGDILK